MPVAMVIHSVYRQIEWKIFKSYEKARERLELEAKVEFATREVELGRARSLLAGWTMRTWPR